MEFKRFTYSELLYTLKVDQSLNILFVEGNRDMYFWRKICPISERKNSVVYSADTIEIDCQLGGNKGRLVELARMILTQELGDRVKIFIDADYDHLVSKTLPSNVITTDWKDLESYALEEDTISELVNTGLAKNIDANHLLNQVINISIPIGVLRIVSEEQSLNLPFNKTFSNNGRRKIINNESDVVSVDISNLIDRLLQNANISLTQHDEIERKYLNSYNEYNEIDMKYILHGKDWGYYLAYLCGVEEEQVEPLIYLSMDYNKISAANNISVIKDFLLSNTTH